MPEYYPAFLNLAGKRCVIIGGGMVAQGKIAALRDAGAQITVISPDATAGIQRAAQRGDVEWLSRKYQVGDLAGAFIAVAATNVWHVNREIFEEAEGLGKGFSWNGRCSLEKKRPPGPCVGRTRRSSSVYHSVATGQGGSGTKSKPIPVIRKRNAGAVCFRM